MDRPESDSRRLSRTPYPTRRTGAAFVCGDLIEEVVFVDEVEHVENQRHFVFLVQGESLRSAKINIEEVGLPERVAGQVHAVDDGLVGKLLIIVTVRVGEGAEGNACAPRCDRRDLESKGQVIDGAQGRPVTDVLPAWR